MDSRSRIEIEADASPDLASYSPGSAASSALAGHFASLFTGKLPDAARPARQCGGLAPWQKRKVQAYIESRLEEPVLVKDLAGLVSQSTSYFCRAFKASFGEPPHSYIVRARIERARALMITTSDCLSQIALACGLADQAHLCRRFRQATGTTPGAWRRSHAVHASN
jgi:AraC family transcriptional regulator